MLYHAAISIVAYIGISSAGAQLSLCCIAILYPGSVLLLGTYHGLDSWSRGLHGSWDCDRDSALDSCLGTLYFGFDFCDLVCCPNSHVCLARFSKPHVLVVT
jgi:hypothetical protein